MLKFWGLLGLLAYELMGWLVLRLLVHNSTRVRVLVFDETQEHILLMRNWFGPQVWELPGGGIHQGEKAAVAGQRETREETGIVIRQLTRIGTQRASLKGSKYTLKVFSGVAEDSNALRRASIEVLDVGWYPLDQLPDNRDTLVDEALHTMI